MTPHIEKTSSEKRPASPGTPIGWRDVLRALPSDDARSWVMGPYRDRFSADAFAAQRRAREHMADCLTRCEDMLETLRRNAERLVIRAVRRRLEWEMWR